MVVTKFDGAYRYHLFIINVGGTELSQVTFADRVTDRSVSWSK
jgi:hypothetical protein